MPSKYHLRNFYQDGYFHIFNRGANKLNIFKDEEDFQTFLSILNYYLLSPTGTPLHYMKRVAKPGNRSENVVQNLAQKSDFDLIAYCLMPNHFHFLFHQKNAPSPKTGITNFMRRLSVTYAMYTKDKYRRSGTLLQGRFKNVPIISNNQLLHLSRYIHLNPTKILRKNQKLRHYPYSSYPNFIGKQCPPWLHPQEVLDQFHALPFEEYLEFVENQQPIPPSLQALILE